jgi:hypothetical protein
MLSQLTGKLLRTYGKLDDASITKLPPMVYISQKGHTLVIFDTRTLWGYVIRVMGSPDHIKVTAQECSSTSSYCPISSRLEEQPLTQLLLAPPPLQSPQAITSVPPVTATVVAAAPAAREAGPRRVVPLAAGKPEGRRVDNDNVCQRLDQPSHTSSPRNHRGHPEHQ